MPADGRWDLTWCLKGYYSKALHCVHRVQLCVF